MSAQPRDRSKGYNGYALRSEATEELLSQRGFAPSVDYESHRGNTQPMWRREVDDAPDILTTEELIATRAYARDLEKDSLDEVISGCVASLRRYGFCMVDHVVPRDQVDAVRHELSTEGHAEASRGLSDADRVREGPRGPTQMHEIVLQPLYQQHLCNPAVVGIAQEMLDAHCRIAQAGRRNVASDDQAAEGEAGGFGPVLNRGPDGREWHTDWPHDLSAYGGSNEQANAGCIRQPFPDICMCLSMDTQLHTYSQRDRQRGSEGAREGGSEGGKVPGCATLA
jgi:hypothetical protein